MDNAIRIKSLLNIIKKYTTAIRNDWSDPRGFCSFIQEALKHLYYLTDSNVDYDKNRVGEIDKFIKPDDLDVWHDDEGVWYQCGPQTYGPFATEEEACAEARARADGVS